ncbi:unnamed protein product [Sphagnum balticum]
MSYKMFKLVSHETIKGNVLQSLAQNSAGSDDFGEIVFGGGFAGTGQAGFAGTATIDGSTNNLTVVTVTLGALVVGSVLTGTGIPTGTTITSQVVPLLTGESLGGVGRYIMSANSTSAQTAESITASSTRLTITATSAGVLSGGNVVLATGATGSPYVVDQVLPLLTGEAVGGIGRYILSSVQLWASEAVTTAAATPVVDGDNFTFFEGQWTGRPHYEFNTDTITTNGRKFWLKLLGASALTLGDAQLNTTALGSGAGKGIVRQVTITGHGMSFGNVFAVGTENFLVINVPDVNHVDVYRGYAGSTVAAQAQGSSVLTLANYTGINLGYDVIIPVTALAIATAGPQIATAMVALDGFNTKWNGQVGNGQQMIVTGRKLELDWEYISATNRLFYHRPSRSGAVGPDNAPYIQTTSNTTVFGLFKITNGVGTEVMTPGVQKGEVAQSVVTRVPTAQEVAAGYMDFPWPYPIKSWSTLGFTTSTLATATIGSTVSFSTDFRRLTLTNNGTNNFATTNTIRVSVTF